MKSSGQARDDKSGLAGRSARRAQRLAASVIDTDSANRRAWGLVHFDLGVQHRLIGHDQIENLLGQAFEQRKAIALDVGDDGLGDGPVVQRVIDVIVTHCFPGLHRGWSG